MATCALAARLLRLPLKYPLDGRAHRLVFAMDAPHPAARAAHPFLQLGHHSLHVLLPGLGFFDRDSPADPLVTREWRDVLPCSQRPLVGSEGPAHVVRQPMRCTS